MTDVPLPSTVVPATPPYDLSTRSMPKWQADALGFMKDGTPFMLGFDPQGQLAAQLLTGDNIVKYNNPQLGYAGYNASGTNSGSFSGVAQLLSTFA